jgi:peptide chain release factor 2
MKGGIAFDIENLIERRKTLEKELSDPGVWNNREKASSITKEIKNLKSTIEPWVELKKEIDELVALYNMALEEKEEELEPEIVKNITKLKAELDKLEKTSLFRGEHDRANCYLTIHSGAGGTEACDWVSMLLRMYLRWAERHGYKTSIVDILPGEEAGIKSVTVYIVGEYAYGYLKTEIGIHRLVRISPFDANKRRHTSFASVFCTPEIEDEIEINIDPKDLRIDTYRAQGHGGQHVNKTDSAVRITHLPTGIVAQCQNERSQFKNKEMAMKILKSKLYEHYRAEMEKKKEEMEKSKKDISWGNQIRSYVFQPYTLVKDLRTGVETGNGGAVMDGEIDQFIDAALKQDVMTKAGAV